MSKNKSGGQAHANSVAALMGAFSFMLPVYVFVSLLDVHGWIMLRDFKAAAMSAVLSWMLLRVLFATPELERQMLDPKVSKLQFFKYCLKLLLPFVFKSFKD